MVSSLKPVERPLALSDQVYQTLRANIRDGKILPGQALQEVQLAELLGVSRTPVREALTRLAGDGLLSAEGRSFVVPSLTLADVDDIYDLRGLLEPEALRRVAAQTRDPAVHAPLLKALEASRAAHEAGDSVAFMEANARFRSLWLALVPNPRLAHAVELYANHVHHLRSVTLDSVKVRTVVLAGLKRIARALVAGDGDAAALAMRDHLSEARQAFVAAIGLVQAEPRDDARPQRAKAKA